MDKTLIVGPTFTLEDLLTTKHGNMQLAIFPTKDGKEENKYTAIIGPAIGDFNEMVYFLANGNHNSRAHVLGVFQETTWYPYTEDKTIPEAIQSAVDRVNTINPDYKDEALYLIYNCDEYYSEGSTKPMKPLVLKGNYQKGL